MGLIADIGRWRQRALVDDRRAGLSAMEMATVLRASLPLVRLPQYAGGALQVQIEAQGVSGLERLWMEVGDDGTLRCTEPPVAKPTALARGDLTAWLDVVLDREASLELDGDAGLVETCLNELHRKLWLPNPF